MQARPSNLCCNQLNGHGYEALKPASNRDRRASARATKGNKQWMSRLESFDLPRLKRRLCPRDSALSRECGELNGRVEGRLTRAIHSRKWKPPGLPAASSAIEVFGDLIE